MKNNKIQHETPMADFLFRKAGMKRIPLSGTFELTPVCNFNCRMCYVRMSPEEFRNQPKKPMTLQQWKKLADEVRDAGMLYLLITGGEPFLWPDFWDLYEYLTKKGFVISINTNGSLIDEEAVKRLKNNPPSRLNITLYGTSDETYKRLCMAPNGFTRTKKAITDLLDAGISVKLNCSMTPYNVGDLEEIVRFAEENKMTLEATSYMFPPIRKDPERIGENDRFTPEEAAYWHMRCFRLQKGEETYRKFLKSICQGIIEPIGFDTSCYDPMDGKIRCRAGKASFWVTWDGDLLPCGMMDSPRISLNEMSFTDGWKKITEQTEDIKVSGICKSCKNLPMCHSCAAMATAETGKTDGIPRYMCEMMKATKKIAEEQLRILDTSDVQNL